MRQKPTDTTTRRGTTRKYKRPKQKVRYSKKLAKEICKHVENAMPIKHISKLPGMPSDVAIWNWRKTKDDFRKMFDDAYNTGVFKKMDELDTLMSEEPPSLLEVQEKYGLDSVQDAKVQLSAIMNQRKTKIDGLKFFLSRIAPRFAPELSDSVKVEHTGEVGTVFQIASYALPDSSENGRLIEHEEKDDE